MPQIHYYGGYADPPQARQLRPPSEAQEFVGEFGSHAGGLPAWNGEDTFERLERFEILGYRRAFVWPATTGGAISDSDEDAIGLFTGCFRRGTSFGEVTPR